MATAFAAQKPPLGQKMPQAWSRLENRPLSRRMHREKCRPLVRSASGAPVFANGAVTAAMAFAFNQAVTAAKRRSEDRQLSEERIVGSGEVRVYSASGYGGGGGRIEMDLSIDVYNSAGSLIGYYDVEMSAIVGGPGISLRNIRKTSIGVIRFDTVLKGPPIGNLTSIYQAFDNQPVVMSGGTAVLGVGISAGTFRIGNHYDPAQVIAAHGLGGGFSHFSGHMNVNSVKFRPRDFR